MMNFRHFGLLGLGPPAPSRVVCLAEKVLILIVIILLLILVIIVLIVLTFTLLIIRCPCSIPCLLKGSPALAASC